jgi:purine-nucleoside phosphorylase
MLIDRYLDATFLEKPVPVYYEGAPWIDESWLRSAEELARSMGIPITSGTYCWTSGPSYETPAEIDYFRTKGADAVGMSTLPEVRVAARLGLPALAISALTNFAAGITQEPLTHHEVIETAAQLKPRFEAWMKALIQQAPSLNF